MVGQKNFRKRNAFFHHEIRNISDRLCDEHNLSVIIPQGVGKSYAEWEADKQGTSWKSKLKDAIDITVGTSASFEDFIKQMEQQSYTIKRGKHISFKAPDQERFNIATVDVSELQPQQGQAARQTTARYEANLHEAGQ